MKIGIVGGLYAGKTTLFRALSTEEGEGARNEGGHKAPSLAMVKVPDGRLDYLASFHPRAKIVRAEACFMDVPSPRRERTAAGWEPEALAQIRALDALVAVLRAFENPQVPSPPGGLDPLRDLKELETEFQMADLMVAEKRLERLKKENARGAEIEAVEQAWNLLNEGTSLRRETWEGEIAKALGGFKFLSLKPLLIVLNVAEKGPLQEMTAAVKEWARSQGLLCMEVCCQLEAELAALSADERAEFMQEWGIGELARPRLIESAYALLDLISFLTMGDKEVRAWPIPRGITAAQAAGKIHSDIERGFIRAEVIHYDQLRQAGSPAEAKKRGLLRLEGKEYIVRDGDVVTFRFNV